MLIMKHVRLLSSLFVPVLHLTHSNSPTTVFAGTSAGTFLRIFHVERVVLSLRTLDRME